MLQFYKMYVTTYHNKYEVDTKQGGYFLLDEEPKNEVIDLTWDNLNEFYHSHGITVPFNIWKFKKGRVVSFFSAFGLFFNKDLRDIKEWKSPLNIKVEIEYIKYTPSINFVLNWHDCDIAIRYLKERGYTKDD